MSNVDAVKALLTAIHLDRFAEIEAAHAPDAVFWPFQGPPVRGSVAIQDWYAEFVRAYADCHYSEPEFVEDGDTVAVRATIRAKGSNWREFTQRVVDVCEMREGLVSGRRLYAMLPDVELDKAATAAMSNATGYRGGLADETRSVVQGFYSALLGGDTNGAKALLDAKSALVDSIYGVVTGPDASIDLLSNTPRPAFGSWRTTELLCGAKEAAVELAIDPARPRAADWVRMVDGKIAVIERHWMLREIGVSTASEKRHLRRVIHPM